MAKSKRRFSTLQHQCAAIDLATILGKLRTLHYNIEPLYPKNQKATIAVWRAINEVRYTVIDLESQWMAEGHSRDSPYPDPG